MRKEFEDLRKAFAGLADRAGNIFKGFKRTPAKTQAILRHTALGWAYFEFMDRYDQIFTIQKSSLATEPAIWFGLDNPNPKIMASQVKSVLGPDAYAGDGTGWLPFSIPEEVFISTRMHLTQEQVAELIPILQRFVDTGEVWNGE